MDFKVGWPLSQWSALKVQFSIQNWIQKLLINTGIDKYRYSRKNQENLPPPIAIRFSIRLLIFKQSSKKLKVKFMWLFPIFAQINTNTFHLKLWPPPLKFFQSCWKYIQFYTASSWFWRNFYKLLQLPPENGILDSYYSRGPTEPKIKFWLLPVLLDSR